VTTNLPFLRWLVGHPALRAGKTTTSFLSDYPPLSAPPAAPAEGPWRDPFRLNLPPPARAAAPDVDAHERDQGLDALIVGVTAPMPGTVIRVDVVSGDRVAVRQTLIVLEAMKMEIPIVAPRDAIVEAVYVAEGDAVASGVQLVKFEE
jgi:biotin carboxyl carrier protein